MIGTVGDLVEDIAVRLGGPVNVASDTEARIERRRGGSAANMAVAVARAGGVARFIGQIGADAVGDAMLRSLVHEGVEPVVRRSGRTGTIVVLVDHLGERTMLTDRAACVDLSDPDPSWLDGLAALHVPMYSMTEGSTAETATTLMAWARARSILITIDASSASLIERWGARETRARLASWSPDVLLCNELETAALGGVDAVRGLARSVTVVKQGPQPALVVGLEPDPIVVPSLPSEGVRDTTGAGDAFAAGFLVAATDGADWVDAVRRGHESARLAISLVSSTA